jgi:hypothetical protein
MTIRDGAPSSEMGLDQFIRDRQESDLSQGVCSFRVQALIHGVHNKLGDPNNTSQTSARTADPAGVFTSDSTLALNRLGELGEDWSIYGEESGEPGEVVQRLYFSGPSLDGHLRVMPAFTLIEKANEDGCSVSICHLAEADGFDWSIVATGADEARPVTTNQLLADKPQTNAAVLDSLLILLSSTSDKTGAHAEASDLVEVLHLEELWQIVSPSIPTINGRFASLEANRTPPLANVLDNIKTWVALSGTPTEKTIEIGDHRELRFTMGVTGLIQVESLQTNLGTKPRIDHLGSLVCTDTGDIHFVDPADQSGQTAEPVVSEIIGWGEKAFEVPDMVADPELTQRVNDMVHDVLTTVSRQKQAKRFNRRLEEIVEQWRADRSGRMNPPLRLGSIDISSLGEGTYFADHSYRGLLSADVQANKSQDVFFSPKVGEDRPRLYDCTVQGARSAFEGIIGDRLAAEDCVTAFHLSDVTRSVAHRVTHAFERAEAKDCVAQSCYDAFSYGLSTDCLATYCFVTFDDAHTRSRGLYTDYCYDTYRFGKVGEAIIETNQLHRRTIVRLTPHHRAAKSFDPIPESDTARHVVRRRFFNGLNKILEW